MKKVVCILGSPRSSGNSETIADKFLDTARGLGAEVQTFRLQDLDYKGCHGCMGCKTGSEVCVICDEMANVLAAVAEADVVVLTSPIYFGQVSAQLKGFIDRTFSYLTPDFMTSSTPCRLAPDKKMVFVMTQGSPDASNYDAASAYAGFYQGMGFETHIIRGLGLHAKSEAAGKPELLQQAGDLARTVMA